MLLVYTHKITPRLKYTFKQIVTRILGIKVDFTTVIEEFIAHDSLKMSYTSQPLSKEISIRSHELLFEQGLSDIEINVQQWDETKCFFPTGEKSSLPFDIFAATFYMLSRYEEYLPHVKDEYGRFTAGESLAFKEGFLDQPVVDIWALKFRDILKERFEDYDFPERSYSIKPVIDVPIAYSYKEKGFMRTMGGTIKDLVSLNLKSIYSRYSVILGFRRDPYDTFKWIINKQKQSYVQFGVFFLIGDYSTYDKNNSIHNKNFVSLIKYMSDYCQIGLKASFYALNSLKILKEEKNKMEAIIHEHLQASRHSFSKLNIPQSYRNLVELEIKQDYTMGYTSSLGFRAGTCTPFLFYDLDYEVQTPLQVHPFNCFDFALSKLHSQLDKKEQLYRMIEQVKRVQGTFTPVFHNYTFGNEPQWKGFRELFTIILKSTNED